MAANDYTGQIGPANRTLTEALGLQLFTRVPNPGEVALRTYYDRPFTTGDGTERYTTPTRLADGIVDT